MTAAYWDAQPCNVKHSDKEVGSRAYFEEVTKRRYFVEPHIKRFAEFSAWKGKKVLEIGCGIGTDGEQFARAGATYHGIDLSPKSVDIARDRIEGIAGAFVWHGDGEDTGFGDGLFDLVYSFGVIHHAERPERIVAEARRVLKPDGEFRLMLYAKNSWKAAMIEAGLDQPEAQADCPIARMYTPESAEALLAPHFRIESIEQTHVFPYQVGPYKRGQYVKEVWFKVMPRETFEALQRSLGWHLLIKARPL